LPKLCGEGHWRAQKTKKKSGVVDFFCGLDPQFRDELNSYSQGDMPAVVRQNFSVHRFRFPGTIPKVMLDNEVLRWRSWFSLFAEVIRTGCCGCCGRMASSAGKAASLKEVVAALALDHASMQEIARVGIHARAWLISILT